MKVLMLTPRFPYPPTRGDCIRAWGQLRYLCARHDVWLASLSEARPSPEALAFVRGHCRDVAVFHRPRTFSLARGAINFAAGRTVTEGYFAAPRLEDRLLSWCAHTKFDAVLAFSSATASLGECVPAERRILDMNDVDSVKWERFAERAAPPMKWLYENEGRRLARRERAWAAAYDCTVVVNARENERLVRRCAPRRSAIVRTGVAMPDSRDVTDAARCDPVVALVGSMFYAPNARAALWFGRNVWPRVRAMAPCARWEIIGRNPTRAVRDLARLPGVTVTGAVPDIRPHLDAARVFVAPILDDIGVQTKLIEALSRGRPSVVTDAVAAGMDWAGTPPFLAAADAAGFASQVVRVLQDDAVAAELSRAAYQTAARFYDVERETERIERLLRGEYPLEGDEPRSACGADVLRLHYASTRYENRRAG
ncbi:MAG: glycosyltransferase [Planctomycetes bacterium]|nr:glycosyltransferase [Planctomycetota bacterium]